MMKLSAVLIALLATTASATFRVTIQAFNQSTRIDPLVTPGQCSGHFHTIGGSLSFSSTASPASVVGTATTSDVLGDFSNYWFPTLYHKGTTSPVENVEIRAYYQFQAGQLNASNLPDKIQMGMIFGDPTGKTPSVLDHMHVQCISAANSDAETGDGVMDLDYFQANVTSCPNLRISMLFPYCWNGQPYNQTQGHVLYPGPSKTDLVPRGTCPKSHPYKLPVIKMEMFYKLYPEHQQWTGGFPFVLSTGPSILTLHADAMLSWDKKQFVDLINLCDGTVDKCKKLYASDEGRFLQRKFWSNATTYVDGSENPKYTADEQKCLLPQTMMDDGHYMPVHMPADGANVDFSSNIMLNSTVAELSDAVMTRGSTFAAVLLQACAMVLMLNL